MREQRVLDINQEKIVNTFVIKYFFNKVFTQVEEIKDKKRQCDGIDVIVDNVNVDIKAQSSKNYINNPRPTFILELSCLNRQKEEMLGWFINPEVKTDLYAFVWIPKAFVHNGVIPSIDSIEEIEIMLVDKHKLKSYINAFYTDDSLLELSTYMRSRCEPRLSSKVPNTHFTHSSSLWELPTNLVVKKEVLKQFAIKHCSVTRTTIVDIT